MERPSTRKTHFSCVICGAGPAGMGFLFQVFKSGKLLEVARDGLLIIDKRSSLGAGKLGDYINVTGNTVAKTFLACLEHESFKDVFGDLSEYSALQKKMVEAPNGAPLLSDVGDLLTLATERLIAHLVEHFDVHVLRGHQVERIRCREVRGFEIVYHDLRTPAIRQITTSDTVVTNLGGTQNAEDIDELCRTLGVSLPASCIKTFAADDLLTLTPEQLTATFAPVLAPATDRRANRITVIGGSHSAFSIVDRLALELACIGLEEIAVIHRSPIRLFFETVDDARSLGYLVDTENDVCPISKRVNRSSGLRYRAFEVARSIMSHRRVPGAKPRVDLIDVSSGEAALARAGEYVENSLAMVHAAGYRPNLSMLVDYHGASLPLQLCEGGIEVDTLGRPLDVHGKAVQGLFSFGLGSGFRPDAEIGSEPAFRGRIYGVWIFHHDIGARVLTGVLQALEATAATSSGRHSAENSGGTASPNTAIFGVTGYAER